MGSGTQEGCGRMLLKRENSGKDSGKNESYRVLVSSVLNCSILSASF